MIITVITYMTDFEMYNRVEHIHLASNIQKMPIANLGSRESDNRICKTKLTPVRK